MTRRWLMLAIVILVALPSILYARWIKDKVYLQTEAVGKVEFSHYTHLEMESIGKNCPTCHNSIFHVVAKKNPVFTMADMEKGKACGFCHNGEKAFSVKENCVTCHTAARDIEIQTKNVGTVGFSHEVHLDMFGCNECHPDIFKAQNNSNHTTMKAMEQGSSCGACHDGSTAFSVKEDCVTCHTAAKDIAIQTEKVGKVIFRHDAHTDMFGCSECHPDIFKAQNNSNHATMKDMAEGNSCGACHDGSTAFSVKENCTACHAGDIEYVNADAGNVTFPHEVHIGMFGCDECHPVLFKPEKGADKMTMEAMDKGEFCGACHDGSTAFNVAEDCESCHKM
jgi:c(7)-type cytochrome triheme protein